MENKVAVLAPVSANGEEGGAEKFYKALTHALCNAGVQAEQISIACDESSFEKIEEAYQRFGELDLSAYDGVISTKAPAYVVKHPNHISYLQHTIRVFYDMFETEFPAPNSQLLQQQSLIHQWDKAALSYPNTKKLFVIGHEVRNRLLKYIDIDSEVIHESLLEEKFKSGEYGDYLFMPGRLHRWKRVDLIINAMQYVKAPLKLKIAGVGEDEARYKSLAGGDDRIEFLGKVPEEELVKLYANALAVPFVPAREDFGLVTIEAFRSGKPVLTCIDSGEPTHFVRDGENGFVCPTDPKKLAEKMEYFYNNPEKTREMGLKGKASVSELTWPRIAHSLLAALNMHTVPEFDLRSVGNASSIKTKITILDMQPIDPPVGGGRFRLLGLYHALGENIDARYIGTYDWPGESYRAHALSETLFEIDIPLTQEHHVVASELSCEAGGKVVIDLAFSDQARLSPEYIQTAIKEAADADIVIFSHPWVFPLVKECLRPDQVVVYDSHNVEGFLRAQFLNSENVVEAKLLNQVVNDEYDLLRRADWILTCSLEDLLRFNRIYEISPSKMRIVPNGVMAFTGNDSSPLRKRLARDELGIAQDAFLAIFIGSPYGPNVEAAEFINKVLSTRMPEVTFIIAGGVGERIQRIRGNVIVTGLLSDEGKYQWFYAADVAINPMFSGSGTNIKMFDFMSMELPVVTTSVGARGIDTGSGTPMLIAKPTADSFALAIESLFDEELQNCLAKEGRICVEDGYAWERISQQLGVFLSSRKRHSGQPKPFFSVVIPTYERHGQLSTLIGCLRGQIERDFEIIIVDQSECRWSSAEENFGIPLVYYHSPVKGAVRARNTGAMLAQGDVIAFVDDDCEPDTEWLINARRYFSDDSVIGVEGLIESDRHGDRDWRPVTNVGFENIGFMTANLFARSAAFQLLGGFDLKFDKPHFREDTDFGWRMQELGDVPYAKNVKVFHPAQSRSIGRESSEARGKFFAKDALLYQKHPEKYKILFFKEAHYLATNGFKENLVKGFNDANVDIPHWLQTAIS